MPTREGFTFDGWYTAADGGERVTAKNLNSLLQTNVNADEATLYAHWTTGSSAHTHCVCGSTHKDIGDHTTKQTVTFTPWSDAAALPSVPGNYYLTCNVTIDNTWVPAADTGLCLNGFSITQQNTSSSAIYVGDWSEGDSGTYTLGTNQRTFTLTDCTGNGKITSANCESNGIHVLGSGTFKLFGGSVADNSNTGVAVVPYNRDPASNGTFIMYGGSITGNAGGVNLSNSAFTMHGGEISGNRTSSDDGGGVAIWQNGQFDMRGGKIRGNSAKVGGGVCVYGSTFTMTGGEISGNSASGSGGGVYFHSSTFKVSGSVRITDNVTGGTKDPATGLYTGGKASNVYLGTNNSKITIDGKLENESPIGVTLVAGYRDPKIFTSGWKTNMDESADPAAYFSSDLAGYTVEKTEDGTEAQLVRTAQSIKLDLNSIFKKQLTSNAPFDKLTQTAFTLTLSGGATGVWTLDTTATATITEAGMTESGGVYTASVPFVFADDHEQPGEYSLQNGILTVTALPGQTANLEFDVTEQNDGTAGMTYGTTFSACKFGFELSVDPRTGALIIVPNSMAYTYLGADPVKLTPVLENDGVYRVSGNGVTIQNDFTYTEPEPDDDPGDLIFPILIKQDKGLLNKDDHTAYLTGYPDGTIRPDGKITRAEAAAIFYRLLRADIRRSASASFTDVPAGKWYSDAVATMAGLGVVTGYPDGTFRPDQTITRAEFAAILARIEKDKTGTAAFSDTASHWAAQQIGVASANGWVTGYADGTFRPDQTITRAEAVAMTNRLLERKPQSASDLIPGMYTWTDNADPAKWYYLDLQEATNSHTYTRKTFGYELWRQLKN